MKANISNIQNIVSEIPNVYNEFQNYKHFTELHFEHGWRDVVIPEFNPQTHKIGDVYVLVNDVVTKEVIELTSEEIAELNKVKVPIQVKKLQFKKALVKSGISTSLITNTIYSMPDSLVKDKFIILWEDSEFFERDNKELNTMAVQFNINQEQLDNLFILADTL